MGNNTAKRRTRVLALGMTALAAISVSAGASSLAFFTDTDSVDAGFSSGSIVLDATKVDALTFSAGVMMPGDSKTGEVIVENDGTGQLRYDVGAASTNPDSKDLRSILTLTVKGVDGDGVGCGSFDGASVFASAAVGATASVASDRVLNAGASETLCLRVSLPSGTGNVFQSATTTTTFTFDAEQTANNP